MPTYEYRCRQCGAAFEKFQKMTDAPLTACPSCGGPVDRLIGAGGGLILKGAGFHANDYPSTKAATASATRCGRDRPCCGRDSFCGKTECESG